MNDNHTWTTTTGREGSLTLTNLEETLAAFRGRPVEYLVEVDGELYRVRLPAGEQLPGYAPNSILISSPAGHDLVAQAATPLSPDEQPADPIIGVLHGLPVVEVTPDEARRVRVELVRRALARALGPSGFIVPPLMRR